jgi:hypothetical protein
VDPNATEVPFWFSGEMLLLFRLNGQPLITLPLVRSRAKALWPAVASADTTYTRGGVEVISTTGVLRMPKGTLSKLTLPVGVPKLLFQSTVQVGTRTIWELAFTNEVGDTFTAYT